MSASIDFTPRANERVSIRTAVFPPTSECDGFGILSVDGDRARVALYVYGPHYLRELAEHALDLAAKMEEQDRINRAIADIRAGRLVGA